MVVLIEMTINLSSAKMYFALFPKAYQTLILIIVYAFYARTNI